MVHVGIGRIETDSARVDPITNNYHYIIKRAKVLVKK